MKFRLESIVLSSKVLFCKNAKTKQSQLKIFCCPMHRHQILKRISFLITLNLPPLCLDIYEQTKFTMLVYLPIIKIPIHFILKEILHLLFSFCKCLKRIQNYLNKFRNKVLANVLFNSKLAKKKLIKYHQNNKRNSRNQYLFLGRRKRKC